MDDADEVEVAAVAALEVAVEVAAAWAEAPDAAPSIKVEVPTSSGD